MLKRSVCGEIKVTCFNKMCIITGNLEAWPPGPNSGTGPSARSQRHPVSVLGCTLRTHRKIIRAPQNMMESEIENFLSGPARSPQMKAPSTSGYRTYTLTYPHPLLIPLAPLEALPRPRPKLSLHLDFRASPLPQPREKVKLIEWILKHVHKRVCTQTFRVALFIVAQN